MKTKSEIESIIGRLEEAILSLMEEWQHPAPRTRTIELIEGNLFSQLDNIRYWRNELQESTTPTTLTPEEYEKNERLMW